MRVESNSTLTHSSQLGATPRAPPPLFLLCPGEQETHRSGRPLGRRAQQEEERRGEERRREERKGEERRGKGLKGKKRSAPRDAAPRAQEMLGTRTPLDPALTVGLGVCAPPPRDRSISKRQDEKIDWSTLVPDRDPRCLPRVAPLRSPAQKGGVGTLPSPRRTAPHHSTPRLSLPPERPSALLLHQQERGRYPPHHPLHCHCTPPQLRGPRRRPSLGPTKPPAKLPPISETSLPITENDLKVQAAEGLLLTSSSGSPSSPGAPSSRSSAPR